MADKKPKPAKPVKKDREKVIQPGPVRFPTKYRPGKGGKK